MKSDARVQARALPYPLAGVALQALTHAQRWDDGEDIPSLPFDICRASGLLLRMNAALAASALVASGKTIPELNVELAATLREPSDGLWLALTRRICGALTSRPPPFQILAETLARRSQVEGPSAIVRDPVTTHFEKLVAYRNRVVHGRPLDAAAHDEAIARLRVLFDAHGFYGRYALLARDGDHWFDCSSRAVADDGPATPPRWTSDIRDWLAARPSGTVLLIDPAEPSDRLLLTPFLRYLAAGKSGARYDDLFFLNRATAGAGEYIAYGFEQHVDADEVDGREGLHQLQSYLRCPPMPKDKRIRFAGLADFHEQRFIGRDDVLDEIEHKARTTDAKYIEIRARSGMGKTAIMAHLYRKYGEQGDPPTTANGDAMPASSGDHDFWAFHFCMPFEGRDDPLVVLQNIVAQVCDGARVERSPYMASELDRQRELFVRCLHVVAALRGDRRLVICIDALDEGIPVHRMSSVPNALIGGRPGEPVLPAAVVFVVSYRVDEAGRSRVDSHLEHVPPSWRARVSTADPLPGLDRLHVKHLLTRLAREASSTAPTDETVDVVLAAAVEHPGAGADPFYLRFLGDRILDGTTNPGDPATVPTGLERMFEALWMGLPTDHHFAAHRLLSTLAILRDQGTDELMQQVIGAAGPGLNVSLDDVRALRSSAHKLLVYDGERFNLFHDRFRQFLIGPMGRLGPKHIARLHASLGELAARWNEVELPSAVRAFALHHGPYHLAMGGHDTSAATLLVHYPICDARLRDNRSDLWVRDLEDVWRRSEHELSAQTRSLVDSWVAFARSRAHLLARGHAGWPANKILLQLATEYADDSPVTAAAERWLAGGQCDWTWLRAARRPEQVERSPCVRVLEGHGGSVSGVVRLDDERLLSWADDGVLNVWNIERAALELRISAHRSGVGGVLLLPSERAVSWSPGDSSLGLWDVRAGERVAHLRGHGAGVRGCIVTADGLLVSFAGNLLRTWSVTDGAPGRVLQGHEAAVRGVLAFPKGGVLSWSADSTLRAWDTSTGRAVRIFAGHTASIDGAMLIDESSFMSWGQEDEEDRTANMLRRWDLASGRQVSECVTCCVSPPIVQGHDLLTAPDERWTVSGTNANRAFRDALVDCGITTGIWAASAGRFIVRDAGNTWRLWDGVVPKAPIEIEGVFDWIQELPARGLLALREESIHILDWTGEPMLFLSGHAGRVHGALAMSTRHVVSWGEDRTLRLWDLDLASASPPTQPDDPCESVTVLSPTTLAVASSQHVDIVDRITGDVLVEFFDHSSPLLLPSGRLLTSNSNTLHLVTPGTGRDIRLPINHRGQVRTVTRRPRAGLLVYRSAGMLGFRLLGDEFVLTWSSRELVLWGRAIGMPVASAQRKEDIVGVVADGNRIAAWGDDNFVSVWRWTPARLRSIAQALEANEAARAQLDLVGANVDRASQDKALERLHLLRAELDLPDGLELLATFGEPTPAEPPSIRRDLMTMQPVTRGVQFLDGRVVAWSGNGKIHVWSEGTSARAFSPHKSGVRGLVGVRHGRLLSWGDDGTLALADVKAGSVLKCGAFPEERESPLACYELVDDMFLFRWTQESASSVDRERYMLIRHDRGSATLEWITSQMSCAAVIPWLRGADVESLPPLFARGAGVLAVRSQDGIELHAGPSSASWVSAGAVGVHEIGAQGTIGVVSPSGLQILHLYGGSSRVSFGEPRLSNSDAGAASDRARRLSARARLLEWARGGVARPHLQAMLFAGRSRTDLDIVVRQIVARLLARLAADTDDAAATAFLEHVADSDRHELPRLLASRGVDVEELVLASAEQQPDLELVGRAIAELPASERSVALRRVLAVRGRALPASRLHKERAAVLALTRTLGTVELELSLLSREADEHWASWSTTERIANVERRLAIVPRKTKGRLCLAVDLARLHLLDERPDVARAVLVECRHEIAAADDPDLKDNFELVWEQVGPFTSRLASRIRRMLR